MSQVLDVEYRCLTCGRMAEEPKTMICSCGGELRGKAPAVLGTRDSFGIGKEFKHNGQTIDTWKKWEKAGFKDPLESGVASNRHTISASELRSGIKRKVEKIQKYDSRKRFSVKVR